MEDDAGLSQGNGPSSGSRREHESLLRLYTPFVRAGDLAFDVGANRGSHTSAFLALGARVVAVEPQAECVRALFARFHAEPRVTIVPRALGAAPGHAEMLLNRNDRWSTLSPAFVRARSAELARRGGEWTVRRTVRVTTLDALVDRFGVPAFAKVDVEGFEAEVARGLSRPLPAASFEFHPGHPEPALATVERLERLGAWRYNYAVLDDSRLALPEWVGAEETLRLLSSCASSRPFAKGDLYARGPA